MDKKPSFGVKCIVIAFIVFLVTVSIVWRGYIKLTALSSSDWSQFEADLFATFIGAFIGALIGIPIGLYIHRRGEREREFQQKFKQKQEEKAIFDAILEELESNLDMLENNRKVKDILEHNNPEYNEENDKLDFRYTLLTIQWDTFSPKIGVADNVDILKRLGELYDLQKSCNYWIRQWQDAKYSPVAHSHDQTSSNISAVVGTKARGHIWKHLPQCLKDTHKFIKYELDDNRLNIPNSKKKIKALDLELSKSKYAQKNYPQKPN